VRNAPEVLREWPPIGRYRIRLIARPGKETVLDIREYVEGESFEGFTRRGIAIALDDVSKLNGIVSEVLAHVERRPSGGTP